MAGIRERLSATIPTGEQLPGVAPAADSGWQPQGLRTAPLERSTRRSSPGRRAGRVATWAAGLGILAGAPAVGLADSTPSIESGTGDTNHSFLAADAHASIGKLVDITAGTPTIDASADKSPIQLANHTVDTSVPTSAARANGTTTHNVTTRDSRGLGVFITNAYKDATGEKPKGNTTSLIAVEAELSDLPDADKIIAGRTVLTSPDAPHLRELRDGFNDASTNPAVNTAAKELRETAREHGYDGEETREKAQVLLKKVGLLDASGSIVADDSEQSTGATVSEGAEATTTMVPITLPNGATMQATVQNDLLRRPEDIRTECVLEIGNRYMGFANTRPNTPDVTEYAEITPDKLYQMIDTQFEKNLKKTIPNITIPFNEQATGKCIPSQTIAEMEPLRDATVTTVETSKQTQDHIPSMSERAKDNCGLLTLLGGFAVGTGVFARRDIKKWRLLQQEQRRRLTEAYLNLPAIALLDDELNDDELNGEYSRVSTTPLDEDEEQAAYAAGSYPANTFYTHFHDDLINMLLKFSVTYNDARSMIYEAYYAPQTMEQPYDAELVYRLRHVPSQNVPIVERVYVRPPVAQAAAA